MVEYKRVLVEKGLLNSFNNKIKISRICALDDEPFVIRIREDRWEETDRKAKIPKSQIKIRRKGVGCE